MDEILKNFYASLQPVIGRYRLMEGANVHEHFNKRINDERNRVLQKLAGLDAGVDVDLARQRVNEIADAAIARCANEIEYDNAPRAIRSAHDGIANAVKRIENGRK